MADSGFSGTNGFIWFTGVVEDLEDKTMYSRVKVRIIGWHNPDKAKLPTESLPWAQVIFPVTGARSTSTIVQNDWVFGFFQDGEVGNMPIVMGVYPSRYTELSVDVNQRGFGVCTADTTTPKPPTGVLVSTVGVPSTPMTATGRVDGSIIHFTNNKLVSVCDISGEVKAACNWAKVEFGVIMDTIKAAWALLMKTLGLTPSGTYQEAVSFLKKITAELKYWSKLIKEVTDFSKFILDYARLVRLVIDFILSLPEKLLALLAACLKQLTDSLASGFKELFSGVSGGSDVAGLDDLLKEVEAVGEATGELIKNTTELATLPVQFLDTLSTPSSAEDINKFTTSIIDYNTANPAVLTAPTPYVAQKATNTP